MQPSFLEAPSKRGFCFQQRRAKGSSIHKGNVPVATALPLRNRVHWEGVSTEKWSVHMRGPVIVFAVAFAVIGVIAASSVYVTERNESSMKSAGVQPAPVVVGHRR